MIYLDNTFGIQLSKNSVLLKIIDKRTELNYNNSWIYYYDVAGNLTNIKENKVWLKNMKNKY